MLQRPGTHLRTMPGSSRAVSSVPIIRHRLGSRTEEEAEEVEDSVGCGGCASVRECAKGLEVLGWSRPVGTAENEDDRPTW